MKYLGWEWICTPRRSGKSESLRLALQMARAFGWEVDVALPGGGIVRVRSTDTPDDFEELFRR